MSDGKTGLQLRSLIKKSGELELSLVNVPTPEPADDEVVVRVEATPINPSDLGLLDRRGRHDHRQGVRHARTRPSSRRRCRKPRCGRWRRGSISRCRSAMKAPAS